MEAVIGVLFVLGLMVFALATPVLAIVALVRTSALARRLNELQAEMRHLQTALNAAQKLVRARSASASATSEAAPVAAEAAPREAPAPASPSELRTPAAPDTTLRLPAVPARAAIDPDATLRSVPAPAPQASAPASAPPPTPAQPQPAPSTPAAEPDPSAPARAPSERPPTEAQPSARPPAPTPQAERPQPPRPVAPRQAEPPAAPFDWESLLGLRGAAWAGGVALAIAGLLFAKLAIERGLFTAELRVATMLVVGVGALLVAELSLRRGYSTTANALSGAGIALLYTCFFAAHSLYGLLGLFPTFALMALVTLTACALALRYDALFTALLGLLGGFATPVVLSTGQDRPLGLFSYILLLDLALLGLSLYKQWTSLAMLSLAGTLVIQLGWFGTHMSPAKMLIGLTAFLTFGLLYLMMPSRPQARQRAAFAHTGLLGGLMPFVFALALSSRPGYAHEWPLLFGFMALLDVALVVIGLRRPEPLLIIGAATANALTLPLFALQGLSAEALWGASLAACALVVWLNLPARLRPWLARGSDQQAHWGDELAGVLAGAGLGLFALVLVARGFGAPPWVFLALLATLGLLAVERTRAERLRGVAVLAPAALAALTQVWFFRTGDGAHVLRNLALPLLVALLASLAAGARAARRADDQDPAGFEDEAGTLLAIGLALLGLFGCLTAARLGGDPLPLFAALAVLVGLSTVSALRRDWLLLLPVALGAVATHTAAWQALYFQPGDLPTVLAFYAVFVLFFLLLPLLLPRSWARSFAWRRTPWVTSALAGPALFLSLHDAIKLGWGQAYIGALPLLLGALTLVGLRGVVQRFTPRAGWSEAEHARRLDLLALFAAVALGFVALAIPLQLHRQWITVGWALEALAVWWLLRRLPHAGLRSFGALLFAAVGARLLLNWDNLLRYEERGLPILNWLLYTYGVPALCCLAGSALLRRADARHPHLARPAFYAPAAGLLGLLLIFVLINLEIADFYSVGKYVAFDWERRSARDLTMSAAWGAYAVTLLVIGVWRGARALRLIGLGFLVLTVLKVFLFDLSNLTGVYRILSVLGLGLALMLVSLVYQRFVVQKEAR